MSILERVVRWILVAAATISIGGLILYATGVVWVLECEVPSNDAKRVLSPVVSRMAAEELAATGKVGDIDAKLRSAYPHMIGLDKYRLVTRKVGTEYEVAIEPKWWCVCRATYIVRDGGRSSETVQPLLHLGRY